MAKFEEIPWLHLAIHLLCLNLQVYTYTSPDGMIKSDIFSTDEDKTCFGSLAGDPVMISTLLGCYGVCQQNGAAAVNYKDGICTLLGCKPTQHVAEVGATCAVVLDGTALDCGKNITCA